MRALILGGLGLIGTGIARHLLARGAEVTVLDYAAQAENMFKGVKRIEGSREQLSTTPHLFAKEGYDVVIDLICFTPEQAHAAVRTFGGACGHFIFCSTTCVYGVKTPPGVIVDESFPKEPISAYAKNKLACEQVFMRAHKAGQLKVTIVRPSYTYGPGGPLTDQLMAQTPAWDRIERGLPVLCAGDGQTLCQATHRDDLGKLFAYAAQRCKTYGQEYNATREQVYTWREYYRQVGLALKKPVQLIFMPAHWIVKHEPSRFSLLNEITQYHGAYSSAKARHDVPEFKCEIDFVAGAAQTLADIRRRSAWRSSVDAVLYQKMVDEAMAFGIEPVTESGPRV